MSDGTGFMSSSLKGADIVVSLGVGMGCDCGEYVDATTKVNDSARVASASMLGLPIDDVSTW